MGLSFWKKSKVENSKELNLEEVLVRLPNSKKELTIAECVEELDKVMNMQGYANEDHMVKVGEEEMSVKKMVKNYSNLSSKLAEMEKAANAASEEDVENEEEDEDREEEIEKRKNAKDGEGEEEEKEVEKEVEKEADKDAEKKEGEEKADGEKKMNSKKGKSKDNFDRVMNAASRARAEEDPARVDLMCDKLARGKALF